MFKDDVEEVGDTCRIHVFTKDGNEYGFTACTLDAARGKAEAFKRGFRQGALCAANAALAAAT